MEISHGNSMCLKQKYMFFFLSFHFCKIKNRTVKQVLPREGSSRKRGRRMNMVQILFTHVCKCKNVLCWNCSMNWGGEERRMVEGMNPCIIYSIHFKNLCKCHNVPYPLQPKGNKCWKNNSKKWYKKVKKWNHKIN
jgi:hypothetical protein